MAKEACFVSFLNRTNVAQVRTIYTLILPINSRRRNLGKSAKSNGQEKSLTMLRVNSLCNYRLGIQLNHTVFVNTTPLKERAVTVFDIDFKSCLVNPRPV